MMDPKDVAAICVNIIKAQGLGQAELIDTGIQILAQLNGPAPQEIITRVAVPTPARVERVETLKHQPLVADKGPVLVEPGYSCICLSCGKHVYTVTSPVYTKGMNADDFFGAFEPAGDYIKLAPPFEFENESGAMLTDCRACKASLSLLLAGTIPNGQKLFNKIHGKNKTTTNKGDVYAGSVGAGEVGIE